MCWVWTLFFFLQLAQTPDSVSGRYFLCVRLYVCLLQQNKGGGFHSATVKNFPTCPLHCGCQPTNQRHAASRQRGFDANLRTSNNHYCWFACLPGTVKKQNGAVPHAAHNMAALSGDGALLGNVKKREKTPSLAHTHTQKKQKRRKNHGRICDPGKRMLFSICQRFNRQNCWEWREMRRRCDVESEFICTPRKREHIVLTISAFNQSIFQTRRFTILPTRRISSTVDALNSRIKPVENPV